MDPFRRFRKSSALLALALAAAATASAVDVPAGTEIQLRLKSKVSSQTSKSKDPLEAVVISPVMTGDQFVIPAGAVVRGSVEKVAQSSKGDERSILEATDGACAEALAGLGGEPPLGLLAFDCIARRGVLGDIGIRREIERIAAYAGGAPVAGFYTYGEIARTTGVRGFHNQTLVVLALA